MIKTRVVRLKPNLTRIMLSNLDTFIEFLILILMDLFYLILLFEVRLVYRFPRYMERLLQLFLIAHLWLFQRNISNSDNREVENNFGNKASWATVYQGYNNYNCSFSFLSEYRRIWMRC